MLLQFLITSAFHQWFVLLGSLKTDLKLRQLLRALGTLTALLLAELRYYPLSLYKSISTFLACWACSATQIDEVEGYQNVAVWSDFTGNI